MRPLALLGRVLPLTLALAGPALPSALAAQAVDITLAPAEVAFPSPTEVAFDAGWVDHGGISVTVEPKNRNRQSWQLFISATAADMGGYGKPVQDVLVRAQDASAWNPLSTTETLVAEGTGAGTVTLHFRLLIDWTADEPGVYSVPLRYTASAF